MAMEHSGKDGGPMTFTLQLGETWGRRNDSDMTTTVAYRRPPLYTKQQAAIFHEARYGVIEASTKSGRPTEPSPG